MGTFLIILSVILVSLLLIKPIVYVLATLLFIFKTFGKAILFYFVCIVCFFFTKWIGLDAKFPPITTAQAIWCVIFVVFIPVYFSARKSKK